MATPLSRRSEIGGEPTPAVPAGPAENEYALPVTPRAMAAQAAATLAILTGLWVAISPFFIMLQHGGTNAAVADLIAGLAVAGAAVIALTNRRGFGALQLGSLVLGIWVLISSFILDAKFPIATPMFWSNTFSGAVLAVLALAALATLRPATR